MRLVWRTEWPHWLLMAVLLTVLLWTPEQVIPIHWNLAGRADGFGSKWVAFVFVVGMYALFLVLPRFDPSRANYAQFAGAYNLVRFALLVMLVVLLGGGALGLQSAGLLYLLVGGLLVVTGSVLGKLRPNWFCGVRTPWTLSSKRSWVKTHRLGGWLMIVLGLAEIAAGALDPSSGGQILLVGGGGVVVVTVAYSYIVWRDDPDRQSAVSTRPAD